MNRIKWFGLTIIMILALAACAPAGSNTTPTAAAGAPTTSAGGPTAASTEMQPTGNAAPAGTPVATIPDTALVQKGRLVICTDFPYPPQEFFDENGNPQGLDVEIGKGIASRLGLQPEFVNSVFDTIIAAVKAGKCDIVISAQNITTERQKSVSMIPYFQAGQQLVVLKGNPNNINGPMDLCGKAVAAESGTTEADNLQGVNDYKDKGLTQDCTKAGKPAINVVVTQKDTDALQQLQSSKVVAYFTDSPVAAYYTVQHPDQFQLAGPVLSPASEGISVPCGQDDCTNAPLSPTGQAIQTALKSMMSDGTYTKILQKWNLTDGAVQPQG